MPKLHSSREIVSVLERRGFELVSQRGSHGKFRRKIGRKTLTVIVTMGKREIPQGTFNSILRQGNLHREDFA